MFVLLGTSRYPSVLIVTSWDNPFLNHPVDSGIKLRNLFNRYPSHRSRLLLKPQFWLTVIFWGKPGFITPPPYPYLGFCSTLLSSAQLTLKHRFLTWICLYASCRDMHAIIFQNKDIWILFDREFVFVFVLTLYLYF